MKTMKTLTLVLLLLLYCGEVFAQQPSVNWLNRIKSGQPFKVVFDVASKKFKDTDRMGAVNPMGTLKAGETYTVVFSDANGWAVTGYNKGTGGLAQVHDLKNIYV